MRIDRQRLEEQREGIEPCADNGFACRSLKRGFAVKSGAVEEQHKATQIHRHAERGAEQNAEDAADERARGFIRFQQRLNQTNRRYAEKEGER